MTTKFYTAQYNSPDLVPSRQNGRFNDDGRPAFPPASRDVLEPQDNREIFLIVHPSKDKTAEQSDAEMKRGRHWAVGWILQVDEQQGTIWRRGQIQTETGNNHFTNWGFGVEAAGINTSLANAYPISLGFLDAEKRMQFMRLTTEVPPLEPALGLDYWTGLDYNCQNWTEELLRQAVASNFLSKQIVDAALKRAREYEFEDRTYRTSKAAGERSQSTEGDENDVIFLTPSLEDLQL
ncbi:hypothetical protein BT69DRAFT_1323182 [Atractiella rhizophila]|nr:hypothetical protein BT69DRAFT_1323182 [Atractiella rhizophila]